MKSKKEPSILIISTDACSYRGIDVAGGKHLNYSASTYVMRTLDPVIFSVDWYLEIFKMGYDGIYIASCGTDSPYKNSFDKLAARIGIVVKEMKKMGLSYNRIKVTAICTVCADHFVHELKEFIEQVSKDLNTVEMVA